MQGWHYGKGLIYYRPIFRLTKLAFLRTMPELCREKIFFNGYEIYNLHKWLIINYNYKYSETSIKRTPN